MDNLKYFEAWIDHESGLYLNNISVIKAEQLSQLCQSLGLKTRTLNAVDSIVSIYHGTMHTLKEADQILSEQIKKNTKNQTELLSWITGEEGK
jgi:hypothetical protein